MKLVAGGGFEPTGRSLKFRSLVLIAASREVEAARGSNHRYAEAAASIKRIAATMGMVSDDVLLKLATANKLSEGLVTDCYSTLTFHFRSRSRWERQESSIRMEQISMGDLLLVEMSSSIRSSK